MIEPLVYEGTNVPINLANIQDPEVFLDFESILVRLEISQLLNNLKHTRYVNDIFIIHKSLFKNIYSWGGEIRTTNVNKPEQIIGGLSIDYSNHDDIIRDVNLIQDDIDNFEWKKSHKEENIPKIARIISAIWQVRPFIEGNTRVVCVFSYLFMRSFGLKIKPDFIGKNSKLFRNALVLASLSDYSEYEHLEKILRDAIVTKKLNNKKK